MNLISRWSSLKAVFITALVITVLFSALPLSSAVAQTKSVDQVIAEIEALPSPTADQVAQVIAAAADGNLEFARQVLIQLAEGNYGDGFLKAIIASLGVHMGLSSEQLASLTASVEAALLAKNFLNEKDDPELCVNK